MVNAILFDFGGVITESPFEAFNAFEHERGLPTNFIRDLNSSGHDVNAWAQLERGEISPDEFDELFRKEAINKGHDIGGLEILKLVFTPLRPHMISLVQRCRAQYQVACLTNNFLRTPKLDSLVGKKRLDDWQTVSREFPYVIESAKIGYRKPEERFFQTACDVIGVKPEHAVFLDDIGSNLKPARIMGMTTIKVTDSEQAISALDSILKERQP
ncbi:MAG: HAD-IA family hydrolase [Proteobacteria bacterium]|nr:HAD-IA family hydrolase [Pseudomonadota bacterium]MDA1332322.1 HAD-IA family hydrolase [Pseudomonadota bacterium]